jgi:hypothetical protein
MAMRSGLPAGFPLVAKEWEPIAFHALTIGRPSWGMPRCLLNFAQQRRRALIVSSRAQLLDQSLPDVASAEDANLHS